MGSKSELTKAFIIDTVAPIFNKKGYIATSLSDLTEATGLTKGAIYSNFKNKETLAVKVFKYNSKKILLPLSNAVKQAKDTKAQLFAITTYYKSYFDTNRSNGGCPVLNVGIDANNTNPVLFKLAKEVSKRIEQDLEYIILNGIESKAILSSTNAKLYAKNIYCMIEGAVFMAFTHDDKSYLQDMLTFIESSIYKKILN